MKNEKLFLKNQNTSYPVPEDYKIEFMDQNDAFILIEEIENENVVIERVTKGIQITIRGNLFRSMKADVNPRFIPVIKDISEIIKNCE